MAPIARFSPPVPSFEGVRIGVDMGGTKCAALAVTGDGAILAETSVPTPVGGDAVIDAIVGVVQVLRADAAVRDAGGECGIGVGVPGLVGTDGVMRYAPHLFGVVEIDLRAILRERLDAPSLVLENDNTAATWGERSVGAARGFDDVLYVGLGTGIGGGVVVGGHLVRGRSGFAGEIGHLTIDVNGETCVCGRRGCWELVASGSGLARLAGRQGEIVTEAARAGDPVALGVLGRFAGGVAVGLADLVMTLDPACIVLGGGVLDPAEPLLGLIAAALGPAMGAAAAHRPMPEIRAAALGKRAGGIGAALLVGS
jgi:glucokinase